MIETIVLGGGCFWCLDAVFRQVIGVRSSVCGYACGPASKADYRSVCGGMTGHVEVVQVEFDPGVISYADLLGIFFAIHDPTTLNRQGHDVGSQYRSIIICCSDEQRLTAQKMIAQFATDNPWGAPVVTEIVQDEAFYPAENYHQNYFVQHPEQGYCIAVIAPKVSKFRRQFSGLFGN